LKEIKMTLTLFKELAKVLLYSLLKNLKLSLFFETNFLRS
jgi:hypothetical protein